MESRPVLIVDDDEDNRQDAERHPLAIIETQADRPAGEMLLLPASEPIAVGTHSVATMRPGVLRGGRAFTVRRHELAFKMTVCVRLPLPAARSGSRPPVPQVTREGESGAKLRVVVHQSCACCRSRGRQLATVRWMDSRRDAGQLTVSTNESWYPGSQ